MDIIHALDDEKLQQIASMPLCSLSTSFNSNRRLNAVPPHQPDAQ